MKILFKSVDIENFMSLGAAHIELEDLGYTLVSGVNNNPDDLAKSNGSGKSSIFEAIVWCLTGDTMRGNKNIVNTNTEGGTSVQLEFDCDGKSYKLIRSKDHQKYKTNLKIYVDGEDKSGKGIRDSEKLLTEYLPELTTSLIGSVIILGQGLPNRFTHNSPSGRKDVLEKLCKSDFMIQDLKDRITERRIELNVLLREYEDTILTSNTKLNIAKETLVEDEKQLETLNSQLSYDDMIEQLEITVKEFEVKHSEHSAQYDELSDTQSKLTERRNELQSSKYYELNDIDKLYEPILQSLSTKVNETQVKLNTARNELQRIQSIREVCPTCGQKMPDVHKPDTTELENSIKQYEQHISELSNEQDNTLSKLSLDKQEIDQKYNTEDSTLLKEIKELGTQMRYHYDEAVSYQQKVNTVLSQIETYKIRKLNHTETIQKVMDSINASKQNITQLMHSIESAQQGKSDVQLRLDIISKFNTAVTRDFRGYLLSNVITFINETAKKYSQAIFETDLIEFVLDGNNISISYAGKEYEALSGGERQKVDLIVQFSIRDMLCKHTGFSTNFIALDEIFDNLDDIGCGKIIDMISKNLTDISSIFIITHHNSYLSIPCDKEIKVIKDASGVSYIQ